MLFSIIIPTRNRPEYLVGAVRSALAQEDAGEFEVIVFDNASTVPASNALAGVSDPRLTVVRSENPLAMRDSWEQALSLARGEYVTILGDDDALLPSAVKVGRRLIEEHGIAMLRWDRAHYYWPGYINPALENLCMLPLGKTMFKVDGHWILGQLGKLNLPYSVTPMLSNSWIRTDLIARAREKNGRFFQTASPDVDSGFILAFTARWFYCLNFPLSICAQSSCSNGAQVAEGFFVQNNDSKKDEQMLGAANDYHRLNEQASIVLDSNAVQTMCVSITNSYVQLAGIFGIPGQIFQLDSIRVIEKVLSEEYPLMNAGLRSAYVQCLRSQLADRPGQLARLLKKVEGKTDASFAAHALKARTRPRLGYDEYRKMLLLDCAKFSVSSATELAAFLDGMLNLGDEGMSLVRDSHPKSWIRNIRDLLYKVVRLRDFNFRVSSYRAGI